MSGTRAKLFKNGGSQAVRLPKGCRMAGDEVAVRREGASVVLEPLDEWPTRFIEALGAWPDEIERPRQARLTDLEEPPR